MELHAFDGEVAVAKAHNDAVLAGGSDLEHVGNRTWLDNERVVPGHSQFRVEASKDAPPIVSDG